MKKMIMLSVIVSLLALAGCSTNGANPGPTSEAPAHHHDYKGERQ